jgi:putative transposase
MSVAPPRFARPATLERFSSVTTDKAIRRGSFASVKELVAKINHFVAHYNQSGKPFRWTVTADSILACGGPISCIS